MNVTVESVDYAPEDLYAQTPFSAAIIREIPGDDRPDYWIATPSSPLQWLHDNHQIVIAHLVICARWAGTRIEPGVEHLPIGIAYVTDNSLIEDRHLSLSKCKYI